MNAGYPFRRTIAHVAGSLALILFVTAPGLLAVAASGESSNAIRRTAVVTAVERAKNSVVNISTYEQVYDRGNPFSSFSRDPFFERFFNDFLDNRYKQRSVRSHLGSGVIIDPKGYILTNWHVIERSSSITVTTSDDTEYSATLVGADQKSDIAVLKIEDGGVFSAIPLGSSDDLLIGETVIAIGNPFGLSHTVTTGVVSALHRSIKANNQVYENFIQTDASINPGNSGGPLLSITGELIGINTAIYGNAEGIGFAIPINTARRIVDDLLAYGEVRPPWVGINVQDLTPRVAAQFGYGGSAGVIITSISPGSPAEKSSLQAGDIIIKIDRQKILSEKSFKRILSLYTAGTTLSFTIYRRGTTETITVRAAEMTSDYISGFLWDVIGIRITDNSRPNAMRFNLATKQGVFITDIRKGSQAFRKGLRRYDVLLMAHGVEVSDSAGFKKLIGNNVHRDTIVLLVQRGRFGYYISMEQ